MNIVLAISTIILRLLPHFPNFTPIGAMALFGGAYLPKKYSMPFIIATLILSDYLLLYINPFSSRWINLETFYPPSALIHSTTIFVYGSVLINLIIGKLFLSNLSINRLIGVPLLSSLQFFLITNLGVWVTGMYSRGIEGLLQSYIMALPFFKFTILGDLFYVILFFGAYEIALRIQLNKQHLSLQ